MVRLCFRRFAPVVCLLYLLFVAACGSAGTNVLSNATLTSQPPSPAPQATSTPPGAASTDCPSPGHARAATMPVLSVGTDQRIVYVSNQDPSAPSGASALKIYDVTTRQTKDILTSPQGRIITEARIEGSWVLFTLTSPTEIALQLIRIDGQGYQTVYCSPDISFLAWSPDRTLVAFEEGQLDDASVKLLDLSTGHLQTEVLAPGATPLKAWAGPTSSGPHGAFPVRWLDNTHLYLTGFVADGSIEEIYLLDTAQGANQTLDQVSKLVGTDNFAQKCFDYDASPDGRQLYLSTCSGLIGVDAQGPGQVTRQPATGGTQTPIYSSASLGGTSVRCVSSARVLVVVQNSAGDTSQNGIWVMNADGSQPVQVLSVPAGQDISLSRTHSSSGSGDLYAASIDNKDSMTVSLIYGSTSGANATSFFSLATSAGYPGLVGWGTA